MSIEITINIPIERLAVLERFRYSIGAFLFGLAAGLLLGYYVFGGF